MPNIEIDQRLNLIRQEMRAFGVEAFLIPSGDAHQSEYVAPYWQSRTYFSGFTGSAGILVIGLDFVTLWTDSRYWLQAEQELAGTEIALGKSDPRQSLAYVQDLKKRGVAKLGCDGRQFSVQTIRALRKNFPDLLTTLDLVGQVWTDRPLLPRNEVVVFDEQYTGVSSATKLTNLRKHLADFDAQFYLVTALDDLAWLFNFRGNDVECNPVFYGYALVGTEETRLYLDAEKCSSGCIKLLNVLNVQLRPYAALESDLADLSSEVIAVDESDLNGRLFDLLEIDNWKFVRNPIRLAKALKNKVELSNWRTCMVQDGLALAKAYKWLEEQVEGTVTEAKFSDKIAACRAENPLYRGESFSAIVGYQDNGAIVHYRPEHGKSATIKKEGLLLVDCGGQYLNGTTDITRTICLGTPTVEEKKRFTQVLKGHIALSKAHFPEGTNGLQLDVLARGPLWEDQQNFGHGTGHGVGFFLNVHEGPQSISSGKSSSTALAFQPGMVVSNEPGFYLDGQFGIRIENLIVCQKEGDWLSFETLTLFPLSAKLIDFDQLDTSELDWLRTYHRQVNERLGAQCSGALKEWIINECAPFLEEEGR